MTEEQFIAMHARELIKRLQFCENAEFVDFVVNCVASGDELALEPKKVAAYERNQD